MAQPRVIDLTSEHLAESGSNSQTNTLPFMEEAHPTTGPVRICYVSRRTPRPAQDEAVIYSSIEGSPAPPPAYSVQQDETLPAWLSELSKIVQSEGGTGSGIRNLPQTAKQRVIRQIRRWLEVHDEEDVRLCERSPAGQSPWDAYRRFFRSRLRRGRSHRN